MENLQFKKSSNLINRFFNKTNYRIQFQSLGQ